MEKIKSVDIYIIRPMKLVKKETYKKYYFPYNILYKLGLMPSSNLEELTIYFKEEKSFIDKLKYNIGKRLPEHVHKSSLIVTKKYYSFEHTNLALTVAKDHKYKSFIPEYKDILSDNTYKIKHDYIFDEPEILRIEPEIFKPESLISYLMDSESPNKEETMEEFETRLKQTREREYSIEELKQIRDILLSKEHDSTHIVTKEKTQNFIGAPFYNTAHAYDKHGNKIYPKSKTKIKTI